MRPQKNCLTGRMKKLRIGESGIPGAGKGLFAEEDIKRGEVIVLITGPRHTVAEIEAHHADNDYLLEINDGSGECIDVQGEARYANDARGISVIPGLFNNAQFCSAEDHSMYLAATRRIKAGDEIFVNYGKAYWKEVLNAQKTATANG